MSKLINILCVKIRVQIRPGYQNIYNVKIDSITMPENKEVMKVRTSRKAYLFIYFMIIVLIITVIFIKISGKQLNITLLYAVLIFSGILIIFIEIHRLGFFYKVTDVSLVYSKGIFARTVRKVDLSSISDADSKQTSWQRMLNYGDVDARMFSKDSTLTIKNVNNPEKFADFLEKKMNEKK